MPIKKALFCLLALFSLLVLLPLLLARPPAARAQAGPSFVRLLPRADYQRLHGVQIQTSAGGNSYVTRYTIPADPPPGAWIKYNLKVDAGVFRYVRLLTPAGGGSALDTAELQLWQGGAPHRVLGCAAFGSAPYGPPYPAANVTDGNPATFFAEATDPGYVGLDKGQGSGPAAKSYTLTGPGVLTVGRASAFAVTARGHGPLTVTLTPSGTATSSGPASATLRASRSSGTLTVTPASEGTLTLTPTNSGGATDPAPITLTVVAASTPPPPPPVSAPWTTARAALWAPGRVYNARYDARLPSPLLGLAAGDETAALNADVAFISGHGGGVLYLPVGTYKVDTLPSEVVQCRSGVALAGDGIGLTTLTWGDGGRGTIKNPAFGFNLPTVNLFGFANLSVVCRAPPEPAPYDNNRLEPLNVFGGGGRFFLSAVAWGNGSADAVWPVPLGLLGAHYAVENCVFDFTKSNHGRLFFTYATDVLLSGNVEHYGNGFEGANYCRGVTVKDCVYTRTGGIHTPRAETDGFESSYCVNLSLDGCTFTTNGVVDYANNDNAGFLSQDDYGTVVSARNFDYVGTLTAGTPSAGTVLTDAANAWAAAPASWQVIHPDVCPLYAFFTTGKNVGVRRKVTAHDNAAGTFTVDSPFPMPPARSDKYVLGCFVMQDCTISNCTFQEMAAGPNFYSGGVNCKITGNRLVNSGGCAFIAFDYGDKIFPTFNNLITGNYVSNPNGLQYTTVFSSVAKIGERFNGTPAHGNRIFGNTLVPSPDPQFIPKAGYPTRYVDHYVKFGSPAIFGETAVNGVQVKAKDGIYRVVNGPLDMAAENGDLPFPGENNGVGFFNAAQAAAMPAASVAAPPGAVKNQVRPR